MYGNEIRPTKTEDDLYWYRQYPRSAPEFFVLILDGTTNTKKSDVDPSLSVKLTKQEKKHVDLIISSAAVSDSALYYCALRPTVTGNTSSLQKPFTQWERANLHTVLNWHDIHATNSTVHALYFFQVI